MAVFSVIIPVYNEQETLEYSFKRIKEAFNSKFYERYERVQIVMVNNGSMDRSPEILMKLEELTLDQKVYIEVIHLSRNFMHAGGVYAGLYEVIGDEVGIIDADVQDPPELFEKMIQKLDEGFDVVYGQRKSREGESGFKKFTAWFFYRFINMLTGVYIPKDTGDFRVMKREVVEALKTLEEPDPFLRGLVAWLGFRQVAYPYERESRKFGTTKYPLSHLMRFATNAILSFSVKPLHIAIYLSFIMLLACVGLIGWVFIVYFTGHSVPGWASLLVIFLFAQSMTFAVLGLVGLYVGQIHIGVQGRPRFIKRSPVKKPNSSKILDRPQNLNN